MPSGHFDILCVVVTYYPSESVDETIRILAGQAYTIVVDNGSPSSAVLERIRVIPNTTFVLLDENMGLAHALNIGCDIALSLSSADGVVIFFDQDTRPMTNYAEVMLACHVEAEAATGGLAIIGPRHVESRIDNESDLGSVGLEPVRVIFTSGMSARAATLRKVGAFRTEFFVDHVDSDFCLRARRLGIRSFRALNVQVEHKLGQGTVHKVFGRTVATTNHVPWRRRAMYANRAVLWREHWRTCPEWIAYDEVRAVFGDIVKIALCETNRSRTFAAMMRGLLTGIRVSRSPAWSIARPDVSGPTP